MFRVPLRESEVRETSKMRLFLYNRVINSLQSFDGFSSCLIGALDIFSFFFFFNRVEYLDVIEETRWENITNDETRDCREKN